jgi:large subunit ribosomal protein L14
MLLLETLLLFTVKSAEPRKAVKKHQVVRAVIIRQKQPKKRKNGTYIKFDDNAKVVLEGTSKEPKGTRILGPVARKLEKKV